MINAVIRKLVNLIDSSASEGQRAGLLVDELGRLHVTSSGGQPAQPAAATHQTARGALSAVDHITFADGAHLLYEVTIALTGSTLVYLQIHDVAGAGTIDDTTQLGPGIPLDPAAQTTWILQWPTPWSFSAGVTLALSDTQNGYTASAETARFAGKWS